MKWTLCGLVAIVLYLGFPVSFVMAQEKLAAVVVDVQGDFTTARNGTLAVPGTDEQFIKKISDAAHYLKRHGIPIYATQDWHPANHVSFATNHPNRKPFEAIQIDGRTQVLWPAHCVQGTDGARILIDNSLFEAVVRKGQDSRFDSYSGFQDDGGAQTELDTLLKGASVKKLVVFGIATDYCVKATALDAVAKGYRVAVIEGLSRGVAPDTTNKAIEEMRAKGILILKEMDLAHMSAM